MTHESAVQFATESRIHMALAVADLGASLAFYRILFGQEPTKTRPRYAKFEVAEPPVNLSLNEVEGATGPGNHVAHFGIQVKSVAAVKAVAERLGKAQVATRAEDQVACCYAVQTKVWVNDPDGNKWEIYVVLDNNANQYLSSQGGCCPEVPVVLDAVRRGDLAGAQAAYEKAGGSSACACLTEAVS